MEIFNIDSENVKHVAQFMKKQIRWCKNGLYSLKAKKEK